MEKAWKHPCRFQPNCILTGQKLCIVWTRRLPTKPSSGKPEEGTKPKVQTEVLIDQTGGRGDTEDRNRQHTPGEPGRDETDGFVSLVTARLFSHAEAGASGR